MRIQFELIIVSTAVWIALLSGCESALEQPDVPATKNRLEPRELLQEYYRLIGVGLGTDAVHRYWDPAQFASRTFRKNYTTLNSVEKEKVAKKLQEFICVAYSTPVVAKLFKGVQIDILSEDRNGDLVSINYAITVLIDGTQKSQSGTICISNSSGEWKIVDLNNTGDGLLSDKLRAQYLTSGLTPIQLISAAVEELSNIPPK